MSQQAIDIQEEWAMAFCQSDVEWLVSTLGAETFLKYMSAKTKEEIKQALKKEIIEDEARRGNLFPTRPDRIPCQGRGTY